MKNWFTNKYYEIRAIFFPCNVVKSRYLKRTYQDKATLLPHTILEILSQFIEQECSPGIVDWNKDCKRSSVRKELQDIYDWYHKEYIPFYNGKDKIVNDLYDQLTELDKNKKYKDSWNFEDPEIEKQYETISLEIDSYRYNMSLLLKANCIRVVELMDYLWT